MITMARKSGTPLVGRDGVELKSVASDSYRGHPAHQHTPTDLRWFWKICPDSRGDMTGALEKDETAFNFKTKCFLGSQSHYLYCLNKLVCHRGSLFKPSLSHSSLVCVDRDERVVGSQKCEVKEEGETLE